MIIPSVIGELHKLADSADDNKRVRGRRGLDILADLRKIKKVKVIIFDSEPDNQEVDNKLVTLTKRTKGRLITVDFNLNKVAKAKGVETLNINELANLIKTPLLPEDKLKIKVSALGKEKGQGVGYLDDGTMVVIEGGARLKGKVVTVNVHKILQTEAGQMIFSKPQK